MKLTKWEKQMMMADDAATFIGEWLIKWGRIEVKQYKEKFGTVRVYCDDFGFSDFYSIWRPSYYWIPSWWPYKLDRRLSVILRLFNYIVVPVQKVLYRLRYKQAVRKWPKIKAEILDYADFPDLLKGI